MEKSLRKQLIEIVSDTEVINFYGEKFSPSNIAKFETPRTSDENGIPVLKITPVGFAYYKDTKGVSRRIDAFGRCSTIFAETAKEREKFECLTELLNMVFDPSTNQSNIVKFIKKLDYNFFADKDFYSAVIHMHAQYQKNLVEECKLFKIAPQTKEIEKAMKKIAKICENKHEKILKNEKDYTKAIDSIESNL